ncbi:hypothetical protein N9064_00710 [bacterium]|nr:hypothetical protein [bacterium]
MDAEDIYTLFTKSMDEIKSLIKEVKNDIADNYKEFGHTKIEVAELKKDIEDYKELKKKVERNSKITWAIGIACAFLALGFPVILAKIIS